MWHWNTVSGKTQTYCLKSVCNFKVTRFYLILLCKQHNWTSGTYSVEIILGCVFLGWKLSGRRFLSLSLCLYFLLALARLPRFSHLVKNRQKWFLRVLSTKVPSWSSVMLSILALHFVSKELRAFGESSIATKWRKHAIAGIMCV